MITLVAAIGKNRELGDGGNLPWHIPSDLKHFKKTTLGKTLIMGRKTYESIGGPLPKRETLILTRQGQIEDSRVMSFSSLDDALSYCREHEREEVMIVGGGEIYRQALPLADKLALSRVDFEGDVDTYFPAWSESEWELKRTASHPQEGEAPGWIYEEWVRIRS